MLAEERDGVVDRKARAAPGGSIVGLPPQKSRSVTTRVGDVAARAAADQDLRARLARRRRGARPIATGSKRRAKIAVARPAAPAPTTATCILRDGGLSPAGFSRARPGWRGPTSLRPRTACAVRPSGVHFVGRGERLEALRAARFGDDDLEARALGRRPHFALHRLAAALEEVEHRPCLPGRIPAIRVEPPQLLPANLGRAQRRDDVVGQILGHFDQREPSAISIAPIAATRRPASPVIAPTRSPGRMPARRPAPMNSRAHIAVARRRLRGRRPLALAAPADPAPLARPAADACRSGGAARPGAVTAGNLVVVAVSRRPPRAPASPPPPRCRRCRTPAPATRRPRATWSRSPASEPLAQRRARERRAAARAGRRPSARVATSIFCLVSCSMLRSSRCSRGSASVIAVPSRPARPVRPMRCTYASGDAGTS